MSTSEFRFNKKRRHYAYLFKTIGVYRRNILLSTKPIRVWHGKIKNNIKLFKHPNANSLKAIYIIPIIYVDHIDSFYPKILRWSFDKNDKRITKRIKRKKTLKKKKTGHALTSIKTGVGPVRLFKHI